MTIRKEGGHFYDEDGRTVMLRGVNLAGSSKVPYPDGATHIKEGFLDHRDVSFVGRPFPLDDADEHFQRLQAWGYNTLRFLVTWEAIEHAAPGQYDTDYLDYVEAIVDKAAEYGFTLFIDPHQDVWSRFTGGDGAPGWTLEQVGFEIANFDKTDAALVHQLHGDPYPRMEWSNNYFKLAAATMFTLFFAGDQFAPQFEIDGTPAQHYLQSHYINAMKQVAQRVNDKPHVIGFDIHNEPSKGYIGWQHMDEFQGRVRFGSCPTPYQQMLMGEGYAQTVQRWSYDLTGVHRMGRETIDPQGARAWQEGVECLWRRHGVWDTGDNGEPRLLQPHYFATVDGQETDFADDFLRPFVNKYADAIHSLDDSAMIFLEFDAFGHDKTPTWSEDDAPNIVYAPHWYDGLTLMTKRYVTQIGATVVNGNRLLFGHGNIRQSYREQLKHHKDLARTHFNDVPTLIGEIGIPYDLNNRVGYTKGDWSAHHHAIDDYFQALEANLLHATIWNYTPDNSNERGDLWNGEDLSIYSPDQRTNPDDINSGGRGLHALLRPYPLATAGEPLNLSYDMQTGEFTYTFEHDLSVDAPTVFYVPNYQYPDGYIVETLDGRTEIDRENQRLYYYPDDKDVPKLVKIKPAVPRPVTPKVSRWRWGLVVVVLLTLWAWWRNRD